MKPHCAAHRRIALASICSNTGLRSPGDEEMIWRTSAVAACRCCASLRSRESLAISALESVASAARRRAGLAARGLALFLAFAVSAFFTRAGERLEPLPARRFLLGDRPICVSLGWRDTIR